MTKAGDYRTEVSLVNRHSIGVVESRLVVYKFSAVCALRNMILTFRQTADDGSTLTTSLDYMSVRNDRFAA